MDNRLNLLASDVLRRLEGNPLPAQRPQLLACLEGVGLLRGSEGLLECSVANLPPSVDLAPLIDHTLLRANATTAEVDQLCDEAMQYGFASVCVNPLRVARAAQRLMESQVKVCTVVGFPLGATTPASKAAEARDAVANGATEVDMVLAIGAAKEGDWKLVREDYKQLRAATTGIVLKVILETCLLTDEEKRVACRLAAEEGLDFVKTSTGFSTGGATAADIALMRESVGTLCGVKASGGIRTYLDALAMVLAGATRLGLSSSITVAQGGSASGGGY